MQKEKFGKYEVLGQLGEGAMGVVFKAQDPVLHRFVAIKTISANLGADDELRQRFQREARAAASLNHPNIITIHDFGEEQGQIYMAMELLEGKDLKDLIGTSAIAGLDDKLSIMEQICDGLSFAHAKLIVHRDLKPGNIHIQPNGQVKVLDFGLARLGSSDMTRTGIVMGTPNYMSPEQVMGEKVDSRSDVFSLGAVFYEILTNHKPFEADSVHAVLYQVVHKEPQSVREWDPDVPQVLVETVEKALEKDPAHRFVNAGGLRETLRGVRHALDAGRIENATLAEMLEFELVDEAELAPVEGGADDGTVALDAPRRPTKPPQRRPAPATRPRVSATARTGPPMSAGATPVPVAPAASAVPYYLAGAALGLVAVGVGGWLLLQSQRPTQPTTNASSAQVGALTEALVGTQLDLASRVLEDKDYEDAIAQAERALKLAPDNRQAQEIIQQARSTLNELNSAADEARTAFEAGDTARASEALSRVLAIDPQHPVAAELTAKLNEFFSSRANEAQQAMARARSAAEDSGASGHQDFRRAADLGRSAETRFGRQEFAEATQGFLQARDSFDRARRAGEKVAAERAAQQAADERAAAEKTAREQAEAVRQAQATLPPVTQPPATQPPVTQPPVTAPPVPGRGFSASRTSIQGAQVKSGEVKGFDVTGVQKPPEFKGKLEFEASPREVRPGDEYTVKIYLTNTGKKSVKLSKIDATTIIDGARSKVPIKLEEDKSRSGRRVLVGQHTGVWQEGVKAWMLDVKLLSDKGEIYRSRLKIQ